MSKNIVIILLLLCKITIATANNHSRVNTIVANYGDIVINEIMYDVNPPPAGLPAYDYIELFNNSGDAQDLSNWIIDLDGKRYSIPSGTMLPQHEYLVISSKKFLQENPVRNQAIISSFNLKVNGNVALLTPDEQPIAFVDYTSKWLEEDKADGGWSLELRNYEYPCLIDGNWAGSSCADGGTPGYENSIYSPDIKDVIPPKILSATIIGDKSISIQTSEAIKPFEKEKTRIYPHKEIESITFEGFGMNLFTISFDSRIQEGTIYTLYINDYEDYSNNSSNDSIDFGMGIQPERGDIVINEILFNASSSTKDYIELYNASDKLLDISNLSIGYCSDIVNLINIKYTDTPPPRLLLLPNHYLTLASDICGLAETYHQHDASTFIQVDNFHNFNNEEGYVNIKNHNEILECFVYKSNMHFSFLSDEKGVSLERLQPKASSTDNNNWHSAAQTYNFGSPGVKNSQYVEPQQELDNWEISISPPTISPNNDGIDDATYISYRFDYNEVLVNIYIFNRRGALFHHLCNNIYVETEGSIAWDGRNERGIIANSGVYIVLVEAITANGKKFRKKLTVNINRQ